MLPPDKLQQYVAMMSAIGAKIGYLAQLANYPHKRPEMENIRRQLHEDFDEVIDFAVLSNK